MNQLNDHDFYLVRAQASRKLARQAVDPAIAAIHFELASRYDGIVIELEQNGIIRTGVQFA